MLLVFFGNTREKNNTLMNRYVCCNFSRLFEFDDTHFNGEIHRNSELKINCSLTSSVLHGDVFWIFADLTKFSFSSPCIQCIAQVVIDITIYLDIQAFVNLPQNDFFVSEINLCSKECSYYTGRGPLHH